MFDEQQIVQASELLQHCRARGMMLATAESCTGGLVASLLTAIAGSSDVFERGFVTYSNAAKTQMLGVPAVVVALHGAVSEEVARAMADGALLHSGAQLSLSITGIAGPSGGSDEKPVGLVYLASAMLGGDTIAQRHVFAGDRGEVRKQAVDAALSLLGSRVNKSVPSP
jgi:nicotinamide-nucleotide amidase